MIKLLQKIFGRNRRDGKEPEVPARTFRRVLTGDYFGLRNTDATAEMIQTAKQEKIDQIRSLGLKPKYLRYARKKSIENPESADILAAHVVFQNEEYDEKLHMIHVTEISFIVPKKEFEEFEKMAEVNLQKDFRDLFKDEQEHLSKGEERRGKPRTSPLDHIDTDE